MIESFVKPGASDKKKVYLYRVLCEVFDRVICQARSLRQKRVYLYRVLCEVYDRVVCQARSFRKKECTFTVFCVRYMIE